MKEGWRKVEKEGRKERNGKGKAILPVDLCGN